LKDLKYLKGKNILVTGGAGFIGSNICEKLISLESKVFCLDNLSTGFLSNIEHLVNNKNFKFINTDIRDFDACDNACKNIDYVLHNAALGSVPRSIKDPITTNNVNINGFLNMLIASNNQNVKRFIFAASSSTYGDSKSLPKKEDIIGKPLSPYAITKYVNELYADNFSRIFNLDYIGLRYFNVFGPRQNPNGAYAAVIPKFIQALLNHESPVINGDGSYSRDFTFVDNVVNMNILAILTENKKSLNLVYNTATGTRITLNELANILIDELSVFDDEIKNIKIKYGPFRTGDIPHSHASVSRAKKLLKYNPKYSFRDGILKSINWYWKNLK
jgi:UDP-N-acetylglucosamine 4-epimerase